MARGDRALAVYAWAHDALEAEVRLSCTCGGVPVTSAWGSGCRAAAVHAQLLRVWTVYQPPTRYWLRDERWLRNRSPGRARGGWPRRPGFEQVEESIRRGAAVALWAWRARTGRAPLVLPEPVT